MKLFRIDQSTKKTSPFQLNPANAPLVFAIDMDSLYSSLGAVRTGLDIACHIAESQKIDPVFINNDHFAIKEFIRAAPQNLLVSINQPFRPTQIVNHRDRLLTIGANCYHDYGYAPCADIVLSPCFNPVRFSQVPAMNGPEREIRKRQVRIDYTCAPSRMRPDIARFELFPRRPPGQAAKPKIIAAYIRRPDGTSLNDLLLKFGNLHEKHNCKFLVSTGPATSLSEEKRVETYLKKLPDSEFYGFNGQKLSTNPSNPFDDFLKRADAIVVTNDTVSTLSDAVATGKPVFLHTAHPEGYYAEQTQADGQNHSLQKTLVGQDRLKLFTEENIMSGWCPKYIDEWRAIADTITGVMQERGLAMRRRPISHRILGGLAKLWTPS